MLFMQKCSIPFQCLRVSNQVGPLVGNDELLRTQHLVVPNMSVYVPLGLVDAAGTNEDNQKSVQEKKRSMHFE
jgi:hypothetical protein